MHSWYTIQRASKEKVNIIYFLFNGMFLIFTLSNNIFRLLSAELKNYFLLTRAPEL